MDLDEGMYSIDHNTPHIPIYNKGDPEPPYIPIYNKAYNLRSIYPTQSEGIQIDTPVHTTLIFMMIFVILPMITFSLLFLIIYAKRTTKDIKDIKQRLYNIKTSLWSRRHHSNNKKKPDVPEDDLHFIQCLTV
jgi:hypothetical protein